MVLLALGWQEVGIDRKGALAGVVIGEMDRQTKAAVNLVSQRVDQWGAKIMRALAYCSRNEQFDPEAFEVLTEED